MKKPGVASWFALLMTMLFAAGAGAAPPEAAPPEVGAQQAAMLRVENAWIRKLPPPLPNGGYAVLRNVGEQPVYLVGVASELYGHVMLHRSDDSKGVSTMRQVERLRIPAHGEVVLQPGGYHLMLMHPQAEIAVGQQVTLQLQFGDGSTLDVAFEVRDATGSPEP